MLAADAATERWWPMARCRARALGVVLQRAVEVAGEAQHRRQVRLDQGSASQIPRPPSHLRWPGGTGPRATSCCSRAVASRPCRCRRLARSMGPAAPRHQGLEALEVLLLQLEVLVVERRGRSTGAGRGPRTTRPRRPTTAQRSAGRSPGPPPGRRISAETSPRARNARRCRSRSAPATAKASASRQSARAPSKSPSSVLGRARAIRSRAARAAGGIGVQGLGEDLDPLHRRPPHRQGHVEEQREAGGRLGVVGQGAVERRAEVVGLQRQHLQVQHPLLAVDPILEGSAQLEEVLADVAAGPPRAGPSARPGPGRTPGWTRGTGTGPDDRGRWTGPGSGNARPAPGSDRGSTGRLDASTGRGPRRRRPPRTLRGTRCTGPGRCAPTPTAATRTSRWRARGWPADPPDRALGRRAAGSVDRGRGATPRASAPRPARPPARWRGGCDRGARRCPRRWTRLRFPSPAGPPGLARGTARRRRRGHGRQRQHRLAADPEALAARDQQPQRAGLVEPGGGGPGHGVHQVLGVVDHQQGGAPGRQGHPELRRGRHDSSGAWPTSRGTPSALATRWTTSTACRAGASWTNRGAAWSESWAAVTARRDLPTPGGPVTVTRRSQLDSSCCRRALGGGAAHERGCDRGAGGSGAGPVPAGRWRSGSARSGSPPPGPRPRETASRGRSRSSGAAAAPRHRSPG